MISVLATRALRREVAKPLLGSGVPRLRAEQTLPSPKRKLKFCSQDQDPTLSTSEPLVLFTPEQQAPNGFFCHRLCAFFFNHPSHAFACVRFFVACYIAVAVCE